MFQFCKYKNIKPISRCLNFEMKQKKKALNILFLLMLFCFNYELLLAVLPKCLERFFSSYQISLDYPLQNG